MNSKMLIDIMNKWKNEATIIDKIHFSINNDRTEVTIYTKNSNQLIGVGGTMYFKYKRIFKSYNINKIIFIDTDIYSI